MPARTRFVMVGQYLDFQAVVGITKHMGGRGAARDLLELCHVDEARDVLEVGCGIGVGPVELALSRDCRVVGVDRSAQMIEWARRRAREHGVAELVEMRVADVTALPFDTGRFDVAFAESVLAFVDDPSAALREMVRVVRPGGYVGFNESIWTSEVTPEIEALEREMGVEVRDAATWRSLCASAGLDDIVVKLRRVDPAAEIRNRLRWVGLPWAIRAWGRTVRLYVTEPDVRAEIKLMFGPGMSAFGSMGYGLLVGRVGPA